MPNKSSLKDRPNNLALSLQQRWVIRCLLAITTGFIYQQPLIWLGLALYGFLQTTNLLLQGWRGSWVGLQRFLALIDFLILFWMMGSDYSHANNSLWLMTGCLLLALIEQRTRFFTGLIVAYGALASLVIAHRYTETELFPALATILSAWGVGMMAMLLHRAIPKAKPHSIAATEAHHGLLSLNDFYTAARFSLPFQQRNCLPVSLLLIETSSATDLPALAQILHSRLRRCDVVAQYQPQQCALLLLDTDTNGAKVLAQAIRQSYLSQDSTSDLLMTGILLDTNTGGLEELLQRLQQTLYQYRHSPHLKEHLIFIQNS